jgi:hypothetical protein
MKWLPVFAIILSFACTGIRFEYTDAEDGSKEMVSFKTYCMFYDDVEKVRLKISGKDSGQIENISWEGERVLSAAEEYPNEKQSFKKLRASVIDDGEGLIVVTTSSRGIYQLRRSYNIMFDEEKEQHIIEVIYNVKNYSSEDGLTQKWEQLVKLAEGSSNIRTMEKLTSEELKKLNMSMKLHRGFIMNHKNKLELEIELEGVRGAEYKIDGSKLSMGNSAAFELGPKQRLSWKVQYRFRKK